MADIQERDALGRIVKVHLSSEEARMMQKRRYEKPVEKNLMDLTRFAGEFLNEEFETPDDLPIDVRLYAQAWAEMGPRSIAASIEFMRAIGAYRRNTQPEPARPKHLNILDLLKASESPVGKATEDEETTEAADDEETG